MMETGYWTDASSMDGLSTCSDAEESCYTISSHVKTSTVVTTTTTATPSSYHHPSASAATPSSASTAATPINPTAANFYLPPTKAYCVGQSPPQPQLINALKTLGLESQILTEEELNPSQIEARTDILIFQDFSGPIFETLRKKGTRLRIYGPPIILDLAASSLLLNSNQGGGCSGSPQFPIPKSGYPVYAKLLKGCKICATGIKSRDELVDIRRRVLYLDGVFLDREGPMTHLLAGRCRGNKYRDAVALDKPILKPEWIQVLWDNRNQTNFDIKGDMDKYKVRAFYGARIALEGFDRGEKIGMMKLIEENEGVCVEPSDLTATHVVKSSSSLISLGGGVKVTSLLSPIVGGAPTEATTSTNNNNPSTTSSSSRLSSKSLLVPMEDPTTTQSPLKRPRFDPPVTNEDSTLGDGLTGAPSVDHRVDWADRAKVLKAEWFWTSIQIEACADENLYCLVNREADDTLLNASICSPAGPFSDTDGALTPTPGGGCGGSSSNPNRRKRKRLLREFVSSLAQVDHPPRTILEDLNEDSETVAQSELDKLVKSPDQSSHSVDDSELAVILKRIEKGMQSGDLKAKMDASSGKGLKRLNEFLHLVETEKNYVSILMNIVKLFKEPCEADDQKAGRVLTPLEIKHIFGPILPIYELHKRVLRDMLHILENYTSNSLIGQIYVKNSEELRKAYEPYIQYFESMKNEILRCETTNPRFMAFLRIAQARPQCGREKLVELVIRPVQRLPSTALVLKNLEKNTEPSHPDWEWIARGVEAIDRVNQTVNQKKEVADARVAIFDVYHEIESCPVELISDHRALLKKYDVIALHYDAASSTSSSSSSSSSASSSYYKNELLTLIVFNDHFQVVKRRSLHAAKGASSHQYPGASTLSMANLRSPAASRKSMKFPSSSAAQKRYKFLEWVNFCHVKKIVNVHDSDPRSFAFIVREPEDLRERVLQFNLPEDYELEKYQKMSVVEFFAKQVAQSVARVDYEHFITTVDSAALNNTGNSSSGFFSRGMKKVGRALSLSRTPSKLKRTVSQMISSPFGGGRSCKKERDPDAVSQSGSENSFTPIRNHFSSISLFGTKRGTICMDGQSTPKSRKTILGMGLGLDSSSSKKMAPPSSFPSIDEN